MQPPLRDYSPTTRRALRQARVAIRTGSFAAFLGAGMDHALTGEANVTWIPTLRELLRLPETKQLDELCRTWPTEMAFLA